ncbi:MAG: alpha/beta hydrolase [Anaerolineales bacterium]|jgi:pimeloyl-ACP methyl ester carboxylesterase|nr:alpha/beta hydrolase [Anaerolineales bacterium]
MHYLDPTPSNTPGVLLLHGLGANGTSWALQLDALQQAGFRPIAPDLPGFGDSPYDGSGWNFKRMAALLAELVSGLDAAPVHLVGLSMGGVIAQQFALDYPQHVRKLVLVSTFSFLRPTSLAQWLYFIQRVLIVHSLGLEQQANLVSKRVFPGPGQEELRRMAEAQIASADPRAYRAAMRCLGLFDSRKRLATIKTPTLVVSGADDSTVPLLHQKRLVELISGARQVILPQAGHAPPIDQAEAFNRHLLGFLQES